MTLPITGSSWVLASVGLISLAIAIIGGGKYAGFAGMIYMVTPAVMTVHGKWNGGRRKKLEKLVMAEA